MSKLQTNYETMVKNIVEAFRQFFKQNPKVVSLVLGVSGGIDSAVVAALAYEATKGTNITLIGRSLPIESNTKEENVRAELAGKAFCDDFKEVDLTHIFYDFISNGSEMCEHAYPDGALNDINLRIAQGNIKARLRMIQLYHLAGTFQGVVLSTDNLTENMLGFWTLHGDVGDFGAIQNLWKTEVYGLAKFLINKYIVEDEGHKANALRVCVEAVPTDGLGITNSDLDQLEASSYAEVDALLIEWENGKFDVNTDEGESRWAELRAHPVIQRHLRTHFKRSNPYNLSRRYVIGKYDDDT